MAKKKSKALVWALLLLLVVGLGGFGARNFSSSVTNVATVGSRQVTVQEYSQAVRSRINQIGQQLGQTLSFKQAEAFGIPNSVLASLVTEKALDEEADTLGLSIGDESVAEQLMKMPAFQDTDGKFSRAIYKSRLQAVGLTEAEFEQSLRDESTRSILQTAALTSVKMPDAYARTLAAWQGETRKVTYATLTPSDLTQPVAAPTDDQLQAWYKAHEKSYASPEKKHITYALLTPDMEFDKVSIDPKAIRAYYDAHKSEYEQPERRLVERLVFPDEKSATAAKSAIDAGTTDFDKVVKDRGLDLQDIDMGDVTRDDLGKAADKVFAAKSDSIVGPIDTDLGPALFRVNGVLQATTTPYEDAAEEIKKQLAQDAAKRKISQMIDTIEDKLAAGATLEDLAKETDMKLDTIDWYPGVQDDIAGYETFSDEAKKITSDDYPEVKQLSDGGIFAMRLDKTIPAATKPFAEVRDQVKADWTADATHKALQAQAKTLAEKIKAGTPIDQLGLPVKTEDTVTRNGSVMNTPKDFNSKVFAMKPGQVIDTDGNDEQQLVVHLDSVVHPGPDDPGMKQLEAKITSQASNALQNDVYRIYSNDVRDRTQVQIQQSAVNSVNSQFR